MFCTLFGRFDPKMACATSHVGSALKTVRVRIQCKKHQHPLTKCKGRDAKCDVCSKDCGHKCYSCAKCNFNLCHKCKKAEETQNSPGWAVAAVVTPVAPTPARTLTPDEGRFVPKP